MQRNMLIDCTGLEFIASKRNNTLSRYENRNGDGLLGNSRNECKANLHS